VLAALRLQVEWGADEALDEAPVDRLRRPAPLVAGASRPARLAPGPAPSPVGTAVERAQAAAAGAATLESLRAAITDFDACPLRDTAAHTVLFEGDLASGLIAIGEAPSAEDDLAGRPLTGPTGDFLDKMLASVGLHRDRLLLAPLIPWRPPGGRPPSPGELVICLPFLHRLIALSPARLVILLGPLAVSALLGAPPRKRRPGTWVDFPIAAERGIQALPLPSLATLLRSAASRRDAWADLRAVKPAWDEMIARK
jgi:uracil-DNA glycosylase